jgi:hypothetical protein
MSDTDRLLMFYPVLIYDYIRLTGIIGIRWTLPGTINQLKVINVGRGNLFRWPQQ